MAFLSNPAASPTGFLKLSPAKFVWSEGSSIENAFLSNSRPGQEAEIPFKTNIEKWWTDSGGKRNSKERSHLYISAAKIKHFNSWVLLILAEDFYLCRPKNLIFYAGSLYHCRLPHRGGKIKKRRVSFLQARRPRHYCYTGIAG